MKCSNVPVHDIARKTQDTAPVKGFDKYIDEKLAQLATKAGTDSKAYKAAIAIGDFGKKHPNWSNFIIAVLGMIIGGLMGGWLPIFAITGVIRVAIILGIIVLPAVVRRETQFINVTIIY